MDLNARVDINFARVDVNLQNRARKQDVSHCYLILLQIFFHFDNSENQGPTYALYKFQPII